MKTQVIAVRFNDNLFVDIKKTTSNIGWENCNFDLKMEENSCVFSILKSGNPVNIIDDLLGSILCHAKIR